MTKIDSVDDLEKLLEQQNAAIKAMGDLVQAMDAKIRACMKLVDDHELVMEKVGIRKAAVEGENPGGIVH
jgi:hypothetical protein